MIEQKVTHEELITYELLRNPVLCTEFIRNFDKVEGVDTPFELTWYQKEMACDFNSYVSLCCGRAIGKTEIIVSLLTWLLIFNVFPDEYVCYIVPAENNLKPVWNGLIRDFRTNSFLKEFIGKKTGINGSDHTIMLHTGATLMCRIGGQSGTGISVIGLHTPFFVVDECLIAGTAIQTPNGRIDIEDCKPGQKIYGWNGEEFVEDTVRDIRKKKRESKILEISYPGNKIRCTPEHRFYTKDGYVEASTLKPGDTLYYFGHTNKKKFWSGEEVQKLVALAKEGFSAEYISKEMKRSEGSLYPVLVKNGLTFRSARDLVPTDEEKEILLGSALGDGSLEVYLNRAAFVTNHSYKQKEYVDWLYEKLGRIAKHKPKVMRNAGWGTYNYSLRTSSTLYLKSIADMLYVNGRKCVTQEILDMLTPLSLAVWFMDDGSANGCFSTHSFTKDENVLISEYLKNRWGIANTVQQYKQRNLWYIRISAEGMRTLSSIIEPFVIPSMKYKITSGKATPYPLDKFKEFMKQCEDDKESVVGEFPLESMEEVIITSVREVNTRAKYVYTLETELNHNYFANGILTKNSGYQNYGTWLELQPTINTFTPGFRLMVSGVPDGRRDKSVCYHCDQENDSYSKHRITALQNPRFSEEDYQKAIKDYNGEDSQDFIHLIFGRHGAQVFALFDRGLLSIEDYPVFKLLIDGIKSGKNITDYYTKLSLLPGIGKGQRCVIGIDLGYSEPTAITIFTLDEFDRFRFHLRIEMSKVDYQIQERIINYLDTKYNPILIGMDKGAGGQGISVYQHLCNELEYAHKDFNKRLIPIDFSTSIVIGMDEDGKEIKSPTKTTAVGVTQEYANNHKIVFSNKDLDMISELERMVYVRNPSGELVYRTVTERGGKGGSDHFTSALLCAMLAYYLENEYLSPRKQKKVLYKVRWNN